MNSRIQPIINISLANKFDEQTLTHIFLKISQVFRGVEYSGFFPSIDEDISPEVFILKTPVEELRSMQLFWSDRGFRLGFYHTIQGTVDIIVKRFGNYYEMDSGCDEKFFDVAPYLKHLLDACEELAVQDIEFDYDKKYGVFYINRCTPQALQSAISCPLELQDSRNYSDYLKAIIENMSDSKFICMKGVRGQEINPSDLYKSSMQQLTSHGNYQSASWHCSWHGYDIKMHFSKYKTMTIEPQVVIKTKNFNGASIIDCAFYVRFLLEAVKNLGIIEVKSYFRRDFLIK